LEAIVVLGFPLAGCDAVPRWVLGCQGFKGALVLPDCPGDSGELVGQCDSGFVVAGSLLQAERPAPQAVVVFGFLAWQSTERAPWIKSMRR